MRKGKSLSLPLTLELMSGLGGGAVLCLLFMVLSIYELLLFKHIVDLDKKTNRIQEQMDAMSVSDIDTSNEQTK